MYILAIETSCDETCCSILKDGRNVLSNIVASQIDEHKLYGGVVPEIASRRHIESISSVCEMALNTANLNLSDIDVICATYAPGLIGALLVGFNFAKALSYKNSIPFVPVHHIKGHIASNYIENTELKPPFISLVVSGGHSHIILVEDYTKFKVLGQTVDDAVGEVYDKIARAIGFKYPGGIYMDKEAQKAINTTINFPTPKLDGKYNFSFSGIKTFALNHINSKQQKGEEIDTIDLAGSFQNRVSDILATKTVASAIDYGIKTVTVCGGVSANTGVRKALQKACSNNGITLYLPQLKYCGDNAAMIGCQGYYEYLDGNVKDYNLNAISSISVED